MNYTNKIGQYHGADVFEISWNDYERLMNILRKEDCFVIKESRAMYQGKRLIGIVDENGNVSMNNEVREIKEERKEEKREVGIKIDGEEIDIDDFIRKSLDRDLLRGFCYGELF